MKQTTFYIIAYDLSNDKRRTKIHNILSGFGKWTQYSLFECHLTDKQYLQLRHKLDKVVVSDKDSVRFYRLCADCLSNVETIGSEQPKNEETIIV